MTIPPFDDLAADNARRHQATLTKPPGSLGRLEDIACWFAGATGRFPHRLPLQPAVLVFAGDHGVTAEGVSAYPSSVTLAMVANMVAGGAAINVLARSLGAPLHVVDVGCASEPAVPREAPGVTYVPANVRRGTGNMRREPAMTRMQAEAALEVGRRVARKAIESGADVLIPGEMGIGNTTSAAALVSVFTGEPPIITVGGGTGMEGAALAHKVQVVQDVLERHRPVPGDPTGVLASVGGLELAAMAGAMLEAAAHRVPSILDGYLANAAALVARAIHPAVVPYLLAGHQSAERGAHAALHALSLAPVLRLDLRLGEGSGAALAIHLLRCALELQCHMATFQSAGITGPHE